MRRLAFVATLLAAAALTACGSGENSGAAEKPQSKLSAAEIAKLPQFKISARPGPRPGGLVVHDLRKGSGAVLERGDTMLVAWAEVPYGESFETTPTSPKKQLKFSSGKFIEGWEKGLPGMRVGGRRELIVPTRLGDTGETTVYQVDLLAVEPPSE